MSYQMTESQRHAMVEFTRRFEVAAQKFQRGKKRKHNVEAAQRHRRLLEEKS